MKNKSKGQISVEMLAIVGVVIIGSIIFATYYLSSINRNIDKATDLDIDLTGYLPGTDDWEGIGGIGGGGGGGEGENPFCGDGVINQITEKCDDFDFGDLTCQNFLDPFTGAYFTGGALNCTNICVIDTFGCTSIGYTGYFELKVTPNNGNSIINEDFPINLELTLFNFSNVEISVSVKKNNIATDKCKINNNEIPSLDSGYSIDNFDSNFSDNYNIKCSETGLYSFIFKGKGVDSEDETIEIEEGILLNVSETTIEDPLFALCGISENTTGEFARFCVNEFIGTQVTSQGSVSFFINQPDYSERNLTTISCSSGNENNRVCFSLGLSS